MRRFLAVSMALLAPATLAATDARAALLVAYDFSAPLQPGDQASTAATFVAAGVTAGPITRGAGLDPVAGDSSINSDDWTTGTGPDPLDYYEFTVGPAGAGALDLESLAFTARRSATGPLAFEVRADTDADFGDSVVLALEALADVTDNFRVTVGLSGVSALQDLTTPVFFRIYGYGAEGALGTFRIGLDVGAAGSDLPPDLRVTGTVGATAVVPEPSSLALGTVGSGLLGIAGWRRRRAA